MWYLFKKHPLWSTIGAIVFFLFISLPSYLGEIWPLLEWARIVTPLPPDQSLPKWIREQAWPGMTSAIFNWIILGSVVGMFVFLAAIIRAVHQNRRDVGWLIDLAQGHSKAMQDTTQNQVRIVCKNSSVTPHLDAKDPHVIFDITICNRSVYPLTLEEKVYQQFTFEGTNLSEGAHIYRKPDESKVTKAKPVNYCTFSIKQYIPLSVASRIQSKEGKAFGANNVSVRFTYRDYTGVPKYVRVNFECQIPIIYPD